MSTPTTRKATYGAFLLVNMKTYNMKTYLGYLVMWLLSYDQSNKLYSLHSILIVQFLNMGMGGYIVLPLCSHWFSDLTRLQPTLFKK